MFYFIFVFRIQIDPWASNSFSKKNAWSIYKGVELSSEKVWTFSIRFTCNCPQYFFNTSKSKLHRLYWLAFASIRDCYDKKFSQYFPVGRVKVSSLSYACDRTKKKFPIIILFSTSIMKNFWTRLMTMGKLKHRLHKTIQEWGLGSRVKNNIHPTRTEPICTRRDPTRPDPTRPKPPSFFLSTATIKPWTISLCFTKWKPLKG